MHQAQGHQTAPEYTLLAIRILTRLDAGQDEDKEEGQASAANAEGGGLEGGRRKRRTWSDYAPEHQGLVGVARVGGEDDAHRTPDVRGLGYGEGERVKYSVLTAAAAATRAAAAAAAVQSLNRKLAERPAPDHDASGHCKLGGIGSGNGWEGLEEVRAAIERLDREAKGGADGANSDIGGGVSVRVKVEEDDLNLGVTHGRSSGESRCEGGKMAGEELKRSPRVVVKQEDESMYTTGEQVRVKSEVRGNADGVEEAQRGLVQVKSEGVGQSSEQREDVSQEVCAKREREGDDGREDEGGKRRKGNGLGTLGEDGAGDQAKIVDRDTGKSRDRDKERDKERDMERERERERDKERDKERAKDKKDRKKKDKTRKKDKKHKVSQQHTKSLGRTPRRCARASNTSCVLALSFARSLFLHLSVSLSLSHLSVSLSLSRPYAPSCLVRKDKKHKKDKDKKKQKRRKSSSSSSDASGGRSGSDEDRHALTRWDQKKPVTRGNLFPTSTHSSPSLHCTPLSLLAALGTCPAAFGEHFDSRHSRVLLTSSPPSLHTSPLLLRTHHFPHLPNCTPDPHCCSSPLRLVAGKSVVCGSTSIAPEGWTLLTWTSPEFLAYQSRGGV